MKLKNIVILLAMPLVFCACKKDGDFDELRHNIVIEGDFDPIFGLPIAKMSADINTLLHMADSLYDSDTLSNYVYLDGNDLLAIHYTYHTILKMDEWRYSDENDTKAKRKASPKDEDPLIHQYFVIDGDEEIPLIKYFKLLGDHQVSFDSMLVSVATDIKAYSFHTVEQFIDRGVNLSFDSISVTIECRDGYSEEVPVFSNSDTATLSTIVSGHHFDILNRYNFAHLLNHVPKRVYYSTRLDAAIPLSVYMEWGDHYLDSLGIDSLRANVEANFDFPLNFSCRNIAYVDTFQVNPIDISDKLDSVEHYLTIDGEKSYIAFEANNHLPLEMTLNAAILDENMEPIVTHIFEGDSTLHAAPIHPLEGTGLWISDGGSTSSFRIPISIEMLRQLRKMRYISFSVSGSSGTYGAQHPTIAIQGKDRLDLRAYIVVAPRIHFSQHVLDPIF